MMFFKEGFQFAIKPNFPTYDPGVYRFYTIIVKDGVETRKQMRPCTLNDFMPELETELLTQLDLLGVQDYL